MRPLGPFGPTPRLAVAVSGGADSMALAILAYAWARCLGGSAEAILVDHGLRPDSADEADQAARRLGALGMAATVRRIRDLAPGAALATRARFARYAALEAACAERGWVHLLLGHHRLDQAETLMIRSLSGSGVAGFAGMAMLVETSTVRLVRPLLGVAPERLRATLQAAGVAWVEDPSNRDESALRARLRLRAGLGEADGEAAEALAAAAAMVGRDRAVSEHRAARDLAAHAELRPEAFAVIRGTRLDPLALAALVGAVSGATYPVAVPRVAALASQLRPATVAGARIVRSGRRDRPFLVVREEGAIAAPIAAMHGALWDGRFRLATSRDMGDVTLGALGDDAAGQRKLSDLPACVLRTLPALRRDGKVLLVPHIGFANGLSRADAAVAYAPRRPTAGAPFFALPGDGHSPIGYRSVAV
jgi:tRNA(Ile)-lysidine synthase